MGFRLGAFIGVERQTAGCNNCGFIILILADARIAGDQRFLNVDSLRIGRLRFLFFPQRNEDARQVADADGQIALIFRSLGWSSTTFVVCPELRVDVARFFGERFTWYTLPSPSWLAPVRRDRVRAGSPGRASSKY